MIDNMHASMGLDLHNLCHNPKGEEKKSKEPKKMVVLDVGGERFSAMRSTLLRCLKSFLICTRDRVFDNWIRYMLIEYWLYFYMFKSPLCQSTIVNFEPEPFAFLVIDGKFVSTNSTTISNYELIKAGATLICFATLPWDASKEQN